MPSSGSIPYAAKAMNDMKRRVRSLRLQLVATCLTLILGFSLWSPAWGTLPPAGQPAPAFQVKSGDNQPLTLDMVKGKVIVLFYENKDVVKKNKELKNQLKKYYQDAPAALQNQVFRLVVINCTSAILPTLPIWKSKLREGSRKEGLTIYGDWDGNMLSSYRMASEDSNFLIIDHNGIVRYATTGLVPSERIPEIKDLLKQLVSASTS